MYICNMKLRIGKIMGILLTILFASALAAALFVNRKSFGRLPRGERLERIRRSPNYRDGEFRNQVPTMLFTSDKNRFATMLGFLFRRQEGLRPDAPVPAVKTDLQALDPAEDLLVWFGHSSCLLQLGGRRILVDPVFRAAAPLGFLNRPFPGTDIYTPEQMPDIDYLLITHDHWDHLDYRTVCSLKERIGRVICPLGVGEHFESWGFAPERLIEMDWDETAVPEAGLEIHCLPARHFSGRGLRSNRTLWASYLLRTPNRQIYLGGDGGYGPHFARIGQQFPGIDLALLENGQYNTDWRNIHTLPEQLPRIAREVGARQIVTVHHSKYALARHRWDEPIGNARRLAQTDSMIVLLPIIGEKVPLDR